MTLTSETKSCQIITADPVQGFCHDHHGVDLVRPRLHPALTRLESRGQQQRLLCRHPPGERRQHGEIFGNIV